MADPVKFYLDRFGPALSSDVAAYLTEKLGMTPVAARKRVSRAAGEVRRLAGVTFPHKARYLYLQQQFGSRSYWSNLVAALLASKSAYGYAIAALQQRDGVVPAWQFPIVCGAPTRQLKHLSPDTIYARLNQAGLVTRVNVSGLGECIGLVQAEGHYESKAPEVRARLLTEDILLLAVKDWLKKLGIVSYDKVAIRRGDTEPKVASFLWDLSAPSFLGHMLRVGKDGTLKNGFVACDVHMGETMTAQGAAPFVRKCVTLRSLRNVGACMQILVASRYDAGAFQLLKQNGIIPATPANMFGDEVAEGLQQLASALEAAAHSIIDPAQFDELFRRLGKIEGAGNQLRGTLFEYLAAEMARKTVAPDVRMNRRFRTVDQKEAEADVVAVRDHHAITLIECKGYSPRSVIPDHYVARWLQHNVPTCFHAIKAHPDWQNLKVAFEFWATAPLSAESIALIGTTRAAINPDRYTIDVRLGPDLHALCQEIRDPGLLTAFEKHFMKVAGEPTSLGLP